MLVAAWRMCTTVNNRGRFMVATLVAMGDQGV